MLSAVLLLTLSCGSERWAVKTLSDPDAVQVDLSHPKETTVAKLREIPAPRYSDANPRDGREHQVFFVEAFVLGYKKEKDDGDFHLVIADDPNGEAGTMIAELPAPDCLDGSRVADELRRAREAFEKLFQVHPPSDKYRVVRRPLRVALTGVAFFDRIHGQRGVAPNGIELHPVLAVAKAR